MRGESTVRGSVHLLACLCGAVLLLAACTSAPKSPEEEIRALVAELEAAAEDKNVARLKDAISDEYSDEEGRDKNVLRAILARVLFQHGSVHLLVRVESVSLEGPSAATAELLVAMAGTEREAAKLLPTVRSDLYAVSVGLARTGGEWKILRAAWEPASLDDLTLD